ncbi:hypothetical protein ACTVZO_40345 [Streptomyces sp. IBSNAI002]|uniref:hypothetical protein n=1 Tax=Streptomyces sp. IBSNAI002 TaxID=3457500 RepID=UPI003FD0EA7B
MGHEPGVALAGADEVVLLPVHSLLADSPISLADVETIARAPRTAPASARLPDIGEPARRRTVPPAAVTRSW